MKKCFKGVAKGMAAALTLAVVISAVSFSPVTSIFRFRLVTVRSRTLTK